MATTFRTMTNYWAPGLSRARDAAIRIHEMQEWFDRCDDDHLMWAAGMAEHSAKPPQVEVENAAIAWGLLSWRLQGEDGPFR